MSRIFITVYLFSVFLFLHSTQGSAQGLPTPNDSCHKALPFCGSNTYSFHAGVNTGYAQSGPCYYQPCPAGPDTCPCLSTTPNPAWYYLQVSQSGLIVITMSSNPAYDIDYMCWGPFTSPTGACNDGLKCDMWVSCSYSGAAVETCTIPNAIAGQFYMLLITNFQNQNCIITFSQTNFGQPGAGATDCNIVTDCSIVSLVPSPTTCNPSTNTYNVSGSIEFSNPPSTGTLTVTDITAIPPVTQVFTSPFNSPQPYLLNGITCDNQQHTIIASFSDSTQCNFTDHYFSPAPSCPDAIISGGGTVCADGSTLPVNISITGAPPFDFTYAINGVPQTPITNFPGPSPYIFNTAIAGTYTLVSVVNAFCAGTVSGSATVNMLPLPVPVITGTASVCLNTTQIYSTAPGMTFYSWNVSSGGTITSGAGTNSIQVLWTAAGPGNVTLTYTGANGCPAASPTILNITVNPLPLVLRSNFSVCSGTAASILLQSSILGSTFSWICSASSISITGYLPGSGPQILQTLSNSSFITGYVIYSITATASGCSGPAVNDTIFVQPVADVFFVPLTQSVCSGVPTNLTIQSNAPAATFTWTASGSSGNVSGFTPGSGNRIQQVLVNSGFSFETVTYLVTPSVNGCNGISGSASVTVNPLPSVAFSLCFDPVTTTTARSFPLRGGTPPGGTYSGTGVNAGLFNPTIAGPGNHLLRYTYTNTWGCTDNKTLNITVIPPPVFTCGNIYTDPRDNQAYPTILIATQCWMAANLNYGSVILSAAMQRDNCSAEKYCYSDNPANCSAQGGLYQWDEMMRFRNTTPIQGLCPPSWHIPVEAEWTILFNNFNGNGFAGNPLKSTGFSGFNALVNGSRFDNAIWNYTGFATFFWTSDAHGPYKAWAHAMNSIDPSVSFYPANRSNAFSVRCVKD